MILGAFESLCERYGVRPPVGLAALIGTADPLERVRATLDPPRSPTPSLEAAG